MISSCTRQREREKKELNEYAEEEREKKTHTEWNWNEKNGLMKSETMEWVDEVESERPTSRWKNATKQKSAPGEKKYEQKNTQE